MRLTRTEFLATAAAIALIAGTSGAPAQQSAPSPKVEQGQQGGGQMGGGTSVQQKDDAKTGKDARGGAQAQGDMKAQGGAQTQGTAPGGGGGTDVQRKDKAQSGAPTRDSKQQAQDRDRQDRSGQKMERGEQDRAGQKTEGGAKAQLSEQQRTRISTTIKQDGANLRRVERTNINFNVNVGAVVPRTVELYPLPATIISVVPAYRGFLYIVVGDELLIIHPRTYEIVAVIDA